MPEVPAANNIPRAPAPRQNLPPLPSPAMEARTLALVHLFPILDGPGTSIGNDPPAVERVLGKPARFSPSF